MAHFSFVPNAGSTFMDPFLEEDFAKLDCLMPSYSFYDIASAFEQDPKLKNDDLPRPDQVSPKAALTPESSNPSTGAPNKDCENKKRKNSADKPSPKGKGKRQEADKGEKMIADEPPKGYIHVRARRGEATDSHSLAERLRREKISEKMKTLQRLVPGCDKVIGKALVLDEIISYVQSLQHQIEFLSMKLASVSPSLLELGAEIEDLLEMPEMQPPINSTFHHEILNDNYTLASLMVAGPQKVESPWFDQSFMSTQTTSTTTTNCSNRWRF